MREVTVGVCPNCGAPVYRADDECIACGAGVPLAAFFFDDED